MPGGNGGSVRGPLERATPEPVRPAALIPSRVRWADLRKRAASAAVLAPAALACLWFGGWWWNLLVAAIGAGLATEWIGLCGIRLASVGGGAVLLTVLAAAFAAIAHLPALAVLLLGGGLVLTWLAGHRADLAAGIPYVGLATIALIWLRADGDAGRANVLFMLLVVWASDIGAYAAGRLVGGPKLAPRVSPAKTWSGAIGGLFAAMAAGAAVALALEGGKVSHILPVAAGIGLAAQLGDLLESAVKRHYGVKDSGRLIPGHGGLLDRLDGVLAAAPVAAVLAITLGRAIELWR
jgi:phosphatidate cytidylyltransferase